MNIDQPLKELGSINYEPLRDAIINLDYSVLMGVTLITAVIFLLSNLIVDILYGVVDPRVRLE